MPLLDLLKYLLLAYLLAPIVVQVQNHSNIAIKLVCSTHLFDETSLCRPAHETIHETSHYTTAIHNEFAGLESLLSHANSVTPLVQSLVQSHLSVLDLIVVVKMSSLDSRSALIDELSVLSTETKQASRNLQKLFAQVRGTTDIMIVVNQHLLTLLEARIPHPSALSAYCSVLGNSLRSSECTSSDLRITEAYEQMLIQFQRVLTTLLLHVSQVQGNLDSIEAKLGVIRNLVAMESGIIVSEQSDPLTYILTLMKMPTRKVSRLNAQLKSVNEITRLRETASWFIAVTFAGLQELDEALQMLRSMALGVELAENAPMEVIIPAFTKGIERLRLVAGTDVSAQITA